MVARRRYAAAIGVSLIIPERSGCLPPLRGGYWSIFLLLSKLGAYFACLEKGVSVLKVVIYKKLHFKCFLLILV